VDGDADFRAMTCQMLVNRVIDYLVDKMVQAKFAGRANVHGRSEPDGLKAFKNANASSAVFRCREWLLGLGHTGFV
jgi:hypothetical protein